jgi:hypothetical protein
MFSYCAEMVAKYCWCWAWTWRMVAMSCSGVRPSSWSSVSSMGMGGMGWGAPNEDEADDGAMTAVVGVLRAAGAAPATGGGTATAEALVVTCLFEGVAWAPAVRCRSDAAGRFVPAAVDGVGMSADGEGSIGRSGEMETRGAGKWQQRVLSGTGRGDERKHGRKKKVWTKNTRHSGLAGHCQTNERSGRRECDAGGRDGVG